MAKVTVRSVLGVERQAELHPGDGHPWFDCPFCMTAIYAEAGPSELGAFVGRHGVCQNPWCLANPAMPLDAARRIVQVAQEAADAAARRQLDHQAALERIASDQAARMEARDAVRAEAARLGACQACALKGLRQGKAKYVRHRGACPLVSRM